MTPTDFLRVFVLNLLTLKLTAPKDAQWLFSMFDRVNGVLFVPSRVDLLPVSEWLPFSLDGCMHNVEAGETEEEEAGRRRLQGKKKRIFAETGRTFDHRGQQLVLILGGRGGPVFCKSF